MTIATARPATILADVAVAVNPEDERWRDAVGKEVIVPFVERRVPMIADERVDPEFGTGALKVTPGHDPLDFEIGRDHGLPEPMVIGLDGRMNEEAGELAGLTQEEAEERILEWLAERGPAREARVVPAHGRALRPLQDRIEPLISSSGGATMDELKKPALAALRAGRVRYHPESAAPIRDRLSLENIRPLEHLAPALVGAPASGLGLPGRPRDGRGDGARGLRRVRLDGAHAGARTCSTRGSPRRSGRSRSSAGRSRRPSSRRCYPGDV